MKSISFLIGGKAGDGIDTASLLLARLFAHIGYRVYVYRDYPSIIRGGHTFSIIRIATVKVTASEEAVDFLLALNQETLDIHQGRLKEDAVILYNSDIVKLATPLRHAAFGIPLETIIKEEKAAPVMRNACIIGALARLLDISWETVEEIFQKDKAKDSAHNIAVASRGYQSLSVLRPIEVLTEPRLPLLTGNEAIGLGLIKGGLTTYIAYPMTPVSGLLHFLASVEEEFSLKVIHPENEISVMMMAMGFSYRGEKVAVGSSGGGFCLMTEGLSFAGMSELPIVVVLGQRTGPSTGLPTYTAQTELHFALHAGQGEFVRLIVSPADAQDAYYWAARALQLAQRYQIPAFILVDKTVCEEVFNFDLAAVGDIKEEKSSLWDTQTPYRRYADTAEGVSPLAFVPTKDAIIKVNSYEHDEAGITTEDPVITQKMQDKRLRKKAYLQEALIQDPVVVTGGNPNASCAILSWGSNKGVCSEVAEILGLKCVHVSLLEPFPKTRLIEALTGVTKLICVENNATGQLATLLGYQGIKVSQNLLKYDGRPFMVGELTARVKRMIS